MFESVSNEVLLPNLRVAEPAGEDVSRRSASLIHDHINAINQGAYSEKVPKCSKTANICSVGITFLVWLFIN